MRIIRFDPSGKIMANSPSQPVFFSRALSNSAISLADASGAKYWAISAEESGLRAAEVP